MHPLRLLIVSTLVLHALRLLARLKLPLWTLIYSLREACLLASGLLPHHSLALTLLRLPRLSLPLLRPLHGLILPLVLRRLGAGVYAWPGGGRTVGKCAIVLAGRDTIALARALGRPVEVDGAIRRARDAATSKLA